MRRLYWLCAAFFGVACGDAFVTSGATTSTAAGGTTSTGGGTTQGGGGSSTNTGGNGETGGSTATSMSVGGNPGVDCPANTLVAPPIPQDFDSDYFMLTGMPTPGMQCDSGGDYRSISNLEAAVPPDCDCGCAPNAAGCTADVELYTQANCGAGGGFAGSLESGACTATVLGSQGSYLGFTARFEGERCTQHEPITRPIPRDHLACKAQVSNACMPVPPAPFAQQVCVRSVGNKPCTNDFPNRFHHVTEVNDNRQCNDNCSCSGPSVNCGGTVTFFNDNSCLTSNLTLSPGGCQPVLANHASAQYVSNPSGMCVQSGGTYTGTVTAAEEVTICCTNY